MTYKQFMKLKAGDVVLWRTPKGGVHMRTILKGPVDEGGAHILLPIRRRSWTRRVVTCYGWNDVKHIITKVTGHISTICLQGEYQRLHDIGFDPRREFVREVKERCAAKTRQGKKLCDRLRPLPT